jgi:hypothetical protein
MKNYTFIKKVFLFTIIFIFSLQIVLSSSFWLNPYEIRQIEEGVNFYIDVDNSETNVIIYVNSSGLINKNFITINECKEINVYKFCINNIEGDINVNKGIILNNKLKPAVQLNYTITKAELILDKIIESEYITYLSSEIKTNLTNIGDKTANEVHFKEIVPNEFTIVSHSKKLEKNKNVLSWKGKIEPNKNEEFFYSIIPQNSGQYEIKNIVDYKSVNKNKILEANTNINFEDALLIEINHNNLQNNVGENLSYSLNLTNNYNSEINILSLKVDTPIGIKNIIWNGILNISEKKEFLIEHFINKKIEGEIKTEIKYNLNNIIKNFNSNEKIETKIKLIDINISSNTSTIKPNEKINLIIKIINQNEISDLDQITCKIKAFNKYYDVNLSKLKANNSFIIGNYIFTAPNTKNYQNYIIKVECDYKIEEIKYTEIVNSNVIYDGIEEINYEQINEENNIESEPIEIINTINQNNNNNNDLNENINNHLLNEEIEIKNNVIKKENIFSRILKFLKIIKN